ncbi:MAG: hypothetical protein IMZ62_15670, partial [Chloroflexi bacterium]|nr:hypothetical protein [Chloroflexota bacterium]
MKRMMKRWSWVVVVLAVFVAGTVFAQGVQGPGKEYKAQGMAGDYLVDIKMDKGPPVVG